MSNTAIDFRAPAVARSTAQRVADGVVAVYIRALAGASAEQTEQGEPDRLPSVDAPSYANRQFARRDLRRDCSSHLRLSTRGFPRGHAYQC